MKDVIKKYLDERAAQDPQFAISYAKPNKNLDECVDYIMSEARKEIKGSSGYLEDEKVFGWAVHYYDEDNIKVEKQNGWRAMPGKHSKVEEAAAKVELTEEEKEQARKLAMERAIEEQRKKITAKPSKPEAKPGKTFVQLDLFG